MNLKYLHNNPILVPSPPPARFACDEDGWMFRANKEDPYPHFFHTVTPAEIFTVTLNGDVDISFMGFGDGKKLDGVGPVDNRPSTN